MKLSVFAGEGRKAFNLLCGVLEFPNHLGSQEGWYAAVHVYVDESGKFSSTEHVAFGAWISDLDAWQAFNQQWIALMSKWGITSIHTTDLMGKREIYQDRKFKEGEKVKLLEECLKAANQAAPIVIGSAVDCVAFRALSSQSRKKLGNDAHIMCFISFLHQLIGILEELRITSPSVPRRPVSIVFDDNPEYAPECYSILTRLRQNNPVWRDWIKSICFGDDEYHTPIQAADVLAWLMRSSLRRKDPVNKHNLSHEQIDELGKLAVEGTTHAIIPYDATALKVLDEGLAEGHSFFDLVKIKIQGAPQKK